MLFFDSDSEDEEVSNAKIKRRVLRDNSNPLELSEKNFVQQFRVNKECFIMILNSSKLPGKVRSTSVPPILQLCSTLSLLASGSYQINIGTNVLLEITIDLKDKDFQQSKLYDRIKCATSEIDRFNFQLSWESIDVTICPSSIANYFNKSGYKVEQHSVQVKSTIAQNFKLPNQIWSQRQVDTDLANAAAEYFASVMLECDTDANQEISTYRPDIELNLHNEQSTHALILYCKGFLSSEFIEKLMEVARLSVDYKSLLFSVNGNEKDPIARISGYTITLLNDTKYFLLKETK